MTEIGAVNRSGQTFSVVIADDDALVVDALAALLDDHPGLRLVGAASSGHEAAELCAKHRPHVVVLDVSMPLGGVDGLMAVRGASPASSVVFYTAQADRRTRKRLLDAGASAVFAKGVAIDLAGDLYDVIAAESVRALPSETRAGEVTSDEISPRKAHS